MQPDPSLNPKDEILVRLSLRLNPRDVAILKFRYGFSQTQNVTLQQLGTVFGITPQRVYQIYKHKTKKLKMVLNDPLLDADTVEARQRLRDVLDRIETLQRLRLDERAAKAEARRKRAEEKRMKANADTSMSSQQ